MILKRKLTFTELAREFRQQEAIDTFQWLPMSSDMNPFEHFLHFIGHNVNQRNPQWQNIAEFTNAILEEWQRFP